MPYTGTSGSYTNVAFTSIGTGNLQTWQEASEMMVKAHAKAVAYYPYDLARTGLTIPVSTAGVSLTGQCRKRSPGQ